MVKSIVHRGSNQTKSRPNIPYCGQGSRERRGYIRCSEEAYHRGNKEQAEKTKNKETANRIKEVFLDWFPIDMNTKNPPRARHIPHFLQGELD